MCTIGALVCRSESGETYVFGFKNSDSPPVGYWHGIAGSEGGHASLAYGIQPQQGINAGLNDQGVLLISSYFGCEVPDTKGGTAESYWRNDLRGMAQAEALSRAGTAQEALEMMRMRYGALQAPAVGGSHVIADRSGKLYVFEHEGVEMAWQDVSGQGWTARSNQAFLLSEAEQLRLPDAIRTDRALRLARTESVLRTLSAKSVGRPEVMRALQQLLASHEGSGGDEPGSICAEGIRQGRSNAALPHVTLSGLIWDVGAAEMHYTAGRPNRAAWRRLGFVKEGVEA